MDAVCRGVLGMSSRVRLHTATRCCCRAMLPQKDMHWSAKLIFRAYHPMYEVDKDELPVATVCLGWG